MSTLSLISLAAPVAPPPSAPPTGQPADGPEPTQVERMLDSSTIANLVGKQMKSGETVTIKSDGQTVLEIHKDGVSVYDNIKRFAGDTFHASSAEVSNIVGQDPAFAFKESALAVKGQVFSGIPQEFQDLAEKGFLPMIRVVALALDGRKAVDTFKNHDATKIDKLVDGGHLLTDVAGLGGAVAFAIPAVGAQVATYLTVAGLVGDVAAYGYHVMKYFHDRGLPTPDPNGLRKP